MDDPKANAAATVTPAGTSSGKRHAWRTSLKLQVNPGNVQDGDGAVPRTSLAPSVPFVSRAFAWVRGHCAYEARIDSDKLLK
ncbi:MAG: hypothetical protein JO212_11235 [Acetobacteraceae bacterium]|nr:hypothetical protein [Acetobacteraceae bacterium]